MKLYAACDYVKIVLMSFFLFVPTSLANKIVTKEAPRFLFHWMKESSTNAEYKIQSISENMLPLPWMYTSYNLVQSIPVLQTGFGLFTWSHPIGGFGTGPTEVYGDFMIAIEIQRDPLRIWEVETNEDTRLLDLKVDFTEFDLIHHKRTLTSHTSQVLYEEWIITNPKVVSAFTADPKVIKPMMREYRQAMRSGLYFTTDQLHAKFTPNDRYTSRFLNSDYARQKYLFPVMDAYIQSRHTKLNPAWLRPFNQCGLMDFIKTDMTRTPD